MGKIMDDYFQVIMDAAAELKETSEKLVGKIVKATLFAAGYQKGAEEAAASSAPIEPAPANGMDATIPPPKDPVEEVEEMLLELNIPGSVRQRANGLLEFRSPYFGSIYGRSPDVIQKKIEEKLSRPLPGSKKAPKKKRSPLLSTFYRETYLPYKQGQKLAASTLRGIEYNIQFLIDSKFDKPIASYTPKDIDTFLRSLTATRKAQIIQGLLNNLFNKAVADGVIKSNPCAPLDKVSHEREEGHALSFADQRTFFENLFADTRATLAKKCYLVFVYLTGARRNEALAVTHDDVDFERLILHIPGEKTKKSNRHMPLSPRAAALLRLLPGDGRYFPFSESVAHSVFRRQIDGYTLHDLRHTFGTVQSIVEEIDVKTVALWMGHSTTQTTLRYYTHPENLDLATFLRGDISEDDKKCIMREKYAEILKIIDNFIATTTKSYPNRTQIVPFFSRDLR